MLDSNKSEIISIMANHISSFPKILWKCDVTSNFMTYWCEKKNVA